ncbi:DNA polymerase III, delta prime subunit [Nitrosomonas aestuarii]|uniref:DNA polymerase III subunit delta' n=1 Tax=Nitrosomonas aestuarii TaxID=52441 RepID=A0A1I4DAR2_9PROT|nr:DNA polymerase III subunit delta' [Nitrosomonas aestuarii]SFK90185.1 DNA polymerase III, delta prime subunit [Nitrosomonas aestuarii]
MNKLFAWQQEVGQKLMRNHEFRCHALLLKGKKGIGKFIFARFLAKSLLCMQPDVDNAACDKCASCGWFEQHTHPNFALVIPQALSAVLGNHTEYVDNSAREEVDGPTVSDKTKKKPGQQIGVDQIRRLNDLVYLSGHQDGYKIVLIYPAEAMNAAAANALLKKLEEPPEKTFFILVSHQPRRLLATVRSRCQQINMPIPDTDTAVRWLKQQANDSNAAQNMSALLAMTGYAPLSALSFQENIKQHQQFIEQISAVQQFDPLALAELLQNQDLTMTVDWLQKWCYDLASCQATGKVRYHPHLAGRIGVMCQQISQQACLAFINFLNVRQPLSRHPVNGRLFLEEILINYGKLIVSSSCTPDFV